MRTRLFLVFFIIYWILGCASHSTLKGPSSTIKHNLTTESAIKAIKEVFQNRNFYVHEEGRYKGVISFSDNVMIPATPDKNGNYHHYRQPVMSMGFDKGFLFWKTIYNVSVKGKRIKINKSVASRGLPKRKIVPVEPEILQDITSQIDKMTINR